VKSVGFPQFKSLKAIKMFLDRCRYHTD